jgi:hypothetical protein
VFTQIRRRSVGFTVAQVVFGVLWSDWLSRLFGAGCLRSGGDFLALLGTFWLIWARKCADLALFWPGKTRLRLIQGTGIRDQGSGVRDEGTREPRERWLRLARFEAPSTAGALHSDSVRVFID